MSNTVSFEVIFCSYCIKFKGKGELPQMRTVMAIQHQNKRIMWSKDDKNATPFALSGIVESPVSRLR